jgi:hypothetical protein
LEYHYVVKFSNERCSRFSGAEVNVGFIDYDESIVGWRGGDFTYVREWNGLGSGIPGGAEKE